MSRFLTRRGLLAALGLAALAVAAPLAPAKAEPALKIGVSAGPYGDILRYTAELAAKKGVEAEIIEFTDWTLINEALNNGDIDANNFQHIPYLDNQVKARGYAIVASKPSIVVPTGVYSSTVKSLADLPEGARVAIPNDPTNGARALFLLEKAGLIGLKEGADISATVLDVEKNPKNVGFIELDAAQLPRSLGDVDAAVVTLNYAVLSGLDPKSALVLEDEHSRWHLVWATRKDNADDARVQTFIDTYRSPEVKQFIQTEFNGTILPTW
ncbi:MetQ/NlpA family ABC transporter substrate-binding protein [Caenispirillum bisanense]|uniref:Lipoprotein n=1 Tax=Caenispirillum bisanense TaxID=414052 RepID=A0A286G2U1_9PROT|nr:MetQ/NlpA family ABC transporter substrate-binding protein [Caenispirillum bisanense]SOD89304.1 D-methionine transport system substrate-binding protein [Caenispirillum bisanense]